MNDHADEPFEVYLSPGAHPVLTGRWGRTLLLAPGVVITILGVVMGALWARDPSTAFFAAVIIGSGLFAISSGRGVHRLALKNRDEPPIAFILDHDGVVVRDRLLPWPEAGFRVDASVTPPMVICGAGKAAWSVERLDKPAEEIRRAAERFAGTGQRPTD